MTYYGTKAYNDNVHELEDRGFDENYNQNFWEESYLDRRAREERDFEIEYEEVE